MRATSEDQGALGQTAMLLAVSAGISRVAIEEQDLPNLGGIAAYQI